MKRLILITCLMLSVFSISEGKPSLPLQINAELSNTQLKDGIAKIRVLINSSIDISDVTVLIHLPLGAALSEGKYEWKGDIKQGEVREFIYTLSVNPEIYYKVEFLAKMDAFGIKGSAFSIVDINPSKKKVESRIPGKVRRLPDGNLVIETKGE